MDLRRDVPAAGLRRLNGVLDWRGVPEGIPTQERTERLREIARELHDVYCAVCHDQIEALNAGHDLVSRSLPRLLRSNSPDQLAREESEILGVLIDAATQQIKAWSEFKAKIESYCRDEDRAR
jgi:hypothetical protein